MMLRLLLAVLLAFSSAAVAQPVSVRTGQHDGFARVVVTYPAPVAWEFGRTEDGYALRARGAALRYDLTEVFTTIPRDRLSAIWVDPDSGTLRFGIGCACHAIAAPFRPGIVVIDIRDGAAPADSPFETTLQDAGRTLPRLAGRSATRPRPRPDYLTRAADPPIEAPQNRAANAVLPPLSARPRSPNSMAAFEPPEVSAGLTDAPQVEVLQTRLLQDLSRAAAAGMIEPVTRLDHSRPRAQAGSAESTPIIQVTTGPRSHQLRVRPAGEAATFDLTDAGDACIPDDQFDLAAWGDAATLPARIGELRSRLIGEFDRPDIQAAVELAQLYLHAGFGAEAREVIGQFMPDHESATTMLALAELVDGGLATGDFPDMETCDGRVALWSVLAAPKGRGTNRLMAAAVERSFSELPLHLRRSLGPMLAERLLDFGAATSARAVRDAIGRAPGDHGPGLAFIEARIADREGDHLHAEDRLRAVADQPGPLSAQAIVALAERALARGDALPGADRLHLEAMERELRNGPEGPALRRALARTLAVAGEPQQALREFAMEDSALRGEIWGLVATSADDPSLVELVFGDDGANGPLDSRERDRLAVARRLVALGFPEEAIRWIGDNRSSEATRIAAQAALKQRDGRSSLRLLAGQGGAEADTIRAEALALIGDPGAARTAWLASDQHENAVRSAWLARDWASADLAAAQGFGDLIAEISEKTASSQQDTPEQGPLARARRLLDQSALTRQRTDSLLSGLDAAVSPAQD